MQNTIFPENAAAVFSFDTPGMRIFKSISCKNTKVDTFPITHVKLKFNDINLDHRKKKHLIIRAGLVIKGFCCLSFYRFLYGFGAVFLNEAKGTVQALRTLVKKIISFILSGDENMFYFSVC